MTRTRRRFSPRDKIPIVCRRVARGIPASQLCREHDRSPHVVYGWQPELLEKGHGHVVFEPKKKDRALAKLEAENARLRETLEKKNEVVAMPTRVYIQSQKPGEL